MKRDKFSPQDLQELLHYDPETGKLFWKFRDLKWFVAADKPSAEKTFRQWNARMAGKEAMTAYDSFGYRHGLVLRVNIKAHVVAMAILTGKWPESCVDHINGVRDDNRASNLRFATLSENGRNQKIPVRNTTGRIGVYRSPTNGFWCAAIKAEGKKKHLGTFASFEAAALVRSEAEKEYGFHENHGRP